MDSAGIEETIDSLRVHVRRGLDRFLLGQYFTEYGLAEDAVLIPDGVNEDNLEASGLTEKHSPFQLFLKAVASEIVKEKGETKGRKKRIREYLEVLQAFKEEWVLYIRKNMRKKVKHTATPFVTMEPSAPKDAGDKNKDAGENKKKGGKRGPRGPYKKRKKKEETTPEPKVKPEPDPEPTPKRQKVLDIDQLRKEFEEERDSIMAQVPEYNKKFFKQVGFAKWSKTYLPAMCLSPYAVPPGDIRDQWMKMFQNVKSKDRINRMSHLVWWIGSKEEMGTYSVVARNQFITYEEGQRKGMHEVPKKIKRMLEQGKKLSSAQQEQVEGLQQLNELALLAPDDREHPTGNFEEEDFWGYDEQELLQGNAAMEVEEEDDGEELLDDDEDEELVDSDVELEQKKKHLHKESKREKVRTIEEGEDAEEVIYDDIVEVPSVPPKKKKAKLEKKRKKKEKSREEQQPNGATVDTTMKKGTMDNELKDTEEVQFPPASPPAAPAPVKTERLSLTEVLGDDEASAGGDSALEDSDYGGDGDVEDEDFGKEVVPTVKETKKLKKKTSKIKNGQDVSDEKSTKKKKEKKDKEPKQPKKRTKAAEQRDLDRCVDEYLPMIENLKAAKERKDVPAIQKKLEVLLPVSDEFAASFFSEYEIPKLMKSTKTVLEEAGGGELLSVYRKLWNRMKASYTEKAKHLPEGFRPKKRRPSVKSTEDDGPALKPVKVESDALPQSTPARDQDMVLVKHESVKIENDSADISGARRISEIENQGTPMKIPIKQEDNRRLSATNEQSAKAPEKAAPKPKKFSVMDFMRKKKETPRDSTSAGAGTDKTASSQSRGEPGKKSVPDWVTAPPPTTFDSFVGSDRREDRLFALEFLLQAAAHFPAGKGVNEESVARALEKAVYEWSETQKKSSTWSDVYWDKIHAVVAAITGKREIGTLVSMIMDGQFSSPTAIIMLSDEDLENSFEGRPLMSSSE